MSQSKLIRIGIIVFISIILSVQIIFSQTNRSYKIDSLKNVIETASHDTIEITALIEYALILRSSSLDSAMNIYQQSMTIAKKKNFRDDVDTIYAYPHLQSKLHYFMAILHYRQANFPQAIENLLKSIEISTTVDDKSGLSNAYSEMGRVYQRMSNYTLALEYYLKSVKIDEGIEEYAHYLGGTFNNIGVLYKRQKDYEAAFKYYMKALKMHKEFNEQARIASVYNNIAVIYNAKKNYSGSLEYYFKALKIDHNLVKKRTFTRVYNGLGYLYRVIYNENDSIIYKLGDWAIANPKVLLDTARYYHLKSLAISKEIGDQYGWINSLIGLAKINSINGEHYQAIKLFKQILKIAESKGILLDQINAHVGLYKEYEQVALKTSDVNKKVEHLQNALIQHKMYTSRKDSVFTEEKSIEMGRLEAQYAYDKQAIADSITFAGEKKIQAAKVQKSRTQLYGTIGVLFLVLGFAIVFFRGREKQKLLNTELKNTQTQLVQSEKMASLGVLTAGIAHEINNPINFVYSGINSLKKDYNDISEILNLLNNSPQEAIKLAKELGLKELMEIIPETIEDIKSGANRTTEIVKGLRNFSRLDDTDLKMADIHEGIDSTLLILKSKYKYRIELIKNYNLSIPEITCFPAQLNQVFMNIINNAIDAIENEGKIEITTYMKDENVYISIKDDGKGIPNEIKNKIFDPFFTTKDVGEGVGLGMSISHGIIEKHKGEIIVNSNKEKGTEFIISIPIK
jgi:two-component system NtrC family sensor kinase